MPVVNIPISNWFGSSIGRGTDFVSESNPHNPSTILNNIRAFFGEVEESYQNNGYEFLDTLSKDINEFLENAERYCKNYRDTLSIDDLNQIENKFEGLKARYSSWKIAEGYEVVCLDALEEKEEFEVVGTDSSEQKYLDSEYEEEFPESTFWGCAKEFVSFPFHRLV